MPHAASASGKLHAAMASDQPDRSTAFAAGSVAERYERHLAPVVFVPWAEILLDAVGVRPGDRVLDVASGTGVVARLAAGRAGAEGRVTASDISAAMLAHAATVAAPPGAAPIERVEASATALTFPDAAYDVVLCQQGMQFFPDRSAAAAQLRRVLRAGGTAGVAVWAAGHRLQPFDDYSETLSAAGVAPPFPRAFESSSFTMGADELGTLLRDAGFTSVEVSLVEHDIAWPDVETAVGGILGTPFGPAVAGLPPDRREAIERELTRRLGGADGAPERRTTVAVVACATA